MDRFSDEIVKEIPGFIQVYKDGRFQKFEGTDVVPAGVDPSSGVRSKDVAISPETNVSVRLYIPKTTIPGQKLPLLVYYHGGGFITNTPATSFYHDFVNLVVAESNVVVVSVDYRTSPEYPLPIGYEDSWAAIKWVGQHGKANGPEPWLNDYADLQNVFIGGDSAGANIAHHMAIRVGSEDMGKVITLQGLILLNPYFWGVERIGSESREHPWRQLVADVWMFVNPGTTGHDDPLINPAKDPTVSKTGCSRVLVCVAEEDILKDRGWYYKEVMDKSGWKGQVEVVEDKGEGHCFFLANPSTENSSRIVWLMLKIPIPMDSFSDEILKEIPGMIRVYKDGRLVRLAGTDVVPPGVDTVSGVQSKDVVVSPETNLSVRLYIPTTTDQHHKLPLLIYYHGGGFVTQSSASPTYHNFLNLIVSESNIVAVSVDYRKAPEYPLPVGYEDSWEAIKWVDGHADGNGPESWLNHYADLQNVFVAGDSAGGNIAHNMAVRVGYEHLRGVKLHGCILLHPFFWGKDRIGGETALNPVMIAGMDEIGAFVHPGSSGHDDPLVNPAKDPNLAGMGCSKVLVFVAEMDFLKDRGWYYKEVLEKCGWRGEVEVVEEKEEGHCFFLANPSSGKACVLRNKICTFINQIHSKA